MTTTYRRTADGERVGPKMHSAVKRVYKQGPYQSKKQLAESVGPHGSLKYGYQIVDRCKRRRLLDVDPDHEEAEVRGKGAVVLTEKGRKYLRREIRSTMKED